ncbi:MAG: HD domain-containing protein [Mariprofundus sp.]|nr:HD domain-containing protein [Mariprofundus sp.]
MLDLNTKNLPEALFILCRHLSDAGGKAWLVGGCVRDLILGIEAKDFDLEVYGLHPETLQAALQQLGRTNHVGQQFGVFKLQLHGMVFDITLPRSEKKTGFGHCGFSITPAPFISTHTASLRRDFTINAMMFDPLNHTLVDHHGGLEDLECGILKHVSPAFAEDPLRPLRAMQFAARLQLTLAPETALLCQSLLHEAHTLSKERIWMEWQKWSHAPHPSYGLQVLLDSGWLSLYPELQALCGCPQSPFWHPEGDVWVHTLQVCDQAAGIAIRNQLDDKTTEQLVLAALCHDLGKPETTLIDDKSENISSPGHSKAGVPLAKSLLHSIAAPARLMPYIAPLVTEHIAHLSCKPTDRAVRRLAHRLEPANIELWEMLAEADASGRAPLPASRTALDWLNIAQKLQQHQSKATALLSGKTLLALGFHSGPALGAILKEAYEAQLDGLFHDEDSAMQWFQRQQTTKNRPEE